MRTRFLMLLLVAAAIPLRAATIRVPQDQPTIRAGINSADSSQLAVSSSVVHGTVNATIFSGETLCPGGDTASVFLFNIGSEPAIVDFSQSWLPEGVSLLGFDMQVPVAISPGDSIALIIQFCNNQFAGSESLDRCTFSTPGTFEGWLDFGIGGEERGVGGLTIVKAVLAPPLPSIHFDWEGPLPDTMLLNGRYELIFSSSNFCTYSDGQISDSRVSFDCGVTWSSGFQSTMYRWGLFSPRDTGSCCILMISITDPLGNVASDSLTFAVVPYKGPIFHVSANANPDWEVGNSEFPFFTLQAAIDAAEDGDTVLVGPGVYAGPGNSSISVVDKSISIIAEEGSAVTIVDGQGSDIVFELMGGPSSPVISLSGFLVRSCQRAIAFSSVNLSIDDIRVVDVSQSGLVAGETAHVEDPGSSEYSLSVTNSDFSKCGASGYRNVTQNWLTVASFHGCTFAENNGAGIQNNAHSSTSFDECTFSGNTFGIDHFTYGLESCKIRNCTFSDNFVGIRGGIVDIDSSEFTGGSIGVMGNGCAYYAGEFSIVDCVFSGTDEAAIGGACIMSLRRCAITQNNGAAAKSWASDFSQWTTLDSCWILDNVGGIHISGAYYLEMKHCVYSGNGAPIYFINNYDGTSARIESSTICDNVGGGIELSLQEGHDSYVRNSIVSGNGGFGLVTKHDLGTVSVLCCNFIDNGLGDFSGDMAMIDTASIFRVDPKFCDIAMYSYGLNQCSFCLPQNNSCGQLIGARVASCGQYCGPKWFVSTSGNDSHGDGSAMLPFRTIQRAIDSAEPSNSVFVSEGTYQPVEIRKPLAIFAAGNRSQTLIHGNATNRCVFVDSTTGTVSFSGFTFTSGHASTSQYSGLGGGLLVRASNVILRNCDILENVSDGVGGGIALIDSASLSMTKCQVYGNSAAGSGGGIVVVDCRSLLIDSSLVDHNISDRNGGGLFVFATAPNDSDPFIITNSIIANNTAHENGMGVGSRRCNLQLSNSIVYHNLADSLASNPNGIFASAGHAVLNCVVIAENSGNPIWVDSTLDTSEVALIDPLFCNPAQRDYTVFGQSVALSVNNSCDLDVAGVTVGCDFVGGDCDGSGVVSITDAVFLINFIFASGPAPYPSRSGDTDCSGRIDITDAVCLINYIFASGLPPCEL